MQSQDYFLLRLIMSSLTNTFPMKASWFAPDTRPHQDGPAYFPGVAILSLGSPVVMDFTPHSSLRDHVPPSRSCMEDGILKKGDESDLNSWPGDCKPFSVVLMPRSLLLFKDKVYFDYLHGIKKDQVQRYDEAVNASRILAPWRVVHPHLDSKGAADETGSDAGTAGSFKRTTTRISLTCRVVLKVHRNFLKV